MRILRLFFLLCFVCVYSQKNYVKEYYPDNTIKQEGWLENNKRQDYWFFYSTSGLKMMEGHYAADKKVNWWIVYDEKGKLSKKIQYEDNKPNGFSIIYKSGKIIQVDKYKNGILINSWNKLSEFKKDNKELF